MLANFEGKDANKEATAMPEVLAERIERVDGLRFSEVLMKLLRDKMGFEEVDPDAILMDIGMDSIYAADFVESWRSKQV